MGKNDAAFQKLAAAHLAGPARFVPASAQQSPTRAAVKQHVAASSSNTDKFNSLVKAHLAGNGRFDSSSHSAADNAKFSALAKSNLSDKGGGADDQPRDDHGRWAGK